MKFLTLFLLCCVAAKDINGAITIGQYTKDIKTRMDSKMAELQSKVSAASGGSKTVKVPTAPKLPTPANPNQEIEKPPKIPLPNPKCDLKGLLALLKALFGKVEGSCSSVEKGCGPIKQQCSKAKSDITMEFSVMFTVTEQVSYEFPTCSEVVDPTIKGLTSAIGKLFDSLGAAISPGTPDGGSASNGTDTSSGGSATNGTDTSSGGSASGGSASGGSASGGSATNGTDTSSGGSATNGTDTSSGGSATNGTSTEISESNAECGKNVDISIKALVMALQKMFLSMNSVTASAQPAPNSNAADAVSASDAFLNYVLQIIKSLLSMVTSVNSTSDLGCSDVAQNLSDTIDATLNKTSGGGKILGSVCVQFSASLTMIYKSVSAVNLEATTSECDKAKTDIASDLGSEAIANGTAADVVNKASKSVADFFGTIGQTCADLKTDAPAMGGKVDSVLTKVSTSISNIFALLLISANESATNGTSTTGSAGNGTDSSTGASTSTDESATDGTSTSTTGSATNGTDSSTGASATNGTSTSTGGSANNGTSSASASQFSIKVDAAVCSLIQYLVNLWSVLTTVIGSLSSDESVAATTATSALESIGKAIAFVCFQVISSLSAIFEKLNQTCSTTLVATVTATGEIDLENDDFGTIGEDLTKLLESSSGSPANGTDASSSGSGTSGNSTATDGGTSSANNGTSSSTAASAR